MITLGDPIVRLVGGSIENMGRVEVYDRVSDQWGTICYNDLEYYNSQHAIARIICTSLKYQGYTAFGPAILSSNIQPSANSPIVNGTIDCGTSAFDYDYIYHCPSFPLNPAAAMSRCTPDQEFVIACRCKLCIIALID